MLALGEEDLFQILDIKNKKIIGEIFLKYLGNGKKGVKMIGIIPDIWMKTADGITGPYLCQKSLIYKINDFDLQKSKIWLKEIGLDSMVS